MKSLQIFLCLLTVCYQQVAVCGAYHLQTLRSLVSKEVLHRMMEKGTFDFLKRPYIEFRGVGGCHRKSLVSLEIFRKLQRRKLQQDSGASEDLDVLATSIALIQPEADETYVSPGTFSSRFEAFTGVALSGRQARRLCDHTINYVTDSINDAYDALACKYGEESDETTSRSPEAFVRMLEQTQTNLFLAFYRGSPGLSDVMQHKFQYIYKATPNGERGWSFDPGFDERHIPCGTSPESGDSGIILHVGLPGQILDHLGDERFRAAYPGRRIMDIDTPVSKLNLPGLDLSEFIAYGFKLLENDSREPTEPGLPFGEFLFPLSLYHFSFAPHWPTGGQKEYLGRPLDRDDLEEHLRTYTHQHKYEDAQTHPLDVSVIGPNQFRGALADPPGVRIRLRRDGINYTVRLLAGKEARFAKTELVQGDSTSKKTDDQTTHWDWNQEKIRFIIDYKKQADQSAEVLKLSPEEIKKHWSIVKKSILDHHRINFCFKTRWLLLRAGLTPENFEEGGLLSDENAVKYYSRG